MSIQIIMFYWITQNNASSDQGQEETIKNRELGYTNQAVNNDTNQVVHEILKEVRS